MNGAQRCICGTDPDAGPFVNWDSSCPLHGEPPPPAVRWPEWDDAACPDCGHVHASPAFGSICVGCPCLSVPAIVGPTPADVDAILDRWRAER